MEEIRINIVDWWDNDFDNNYFIKFLSRYYKVVRSDKPDYLLCSCFGMKHLDFDCVKIFFSGENLTPDFNLYDYAIGFDYLDFGDRYLRYPLFLLYEKALDGAKRKHVDINKKIKDRGFCSFVVSNGKYANPIREFFFRKMQTIDFVASGGAFLNNIGYRIKDKQDFLSQYKFNIAFENSQYPGYCTEKLIEAFASGVIPIYWGDPTLICMEKEYENFINPKSYINIDSFKKIEDALKFVHEIHLNDELYLEILKEPAFLNNNIKEHYENRLLNFFENIFLSPPPSSTIKYHSYTQGGKKIVMSNARISYLKRQRRSFAVERVIDCLNKIRSRFS